MAQQSAAQPTAASNALPFKLATRRYYTNPGNMQAITSAGGVSQIQLLKTGYLSRIKLNVSGTITLSNSGTAAASVTPSVFWPWNLLSNIRLSVNPTDIFNVDGFGAYLANMQNHIAFAGAGALTEILGAGVTAAQGPTAIFGTTTGTLSVPASGNLTVQVGQIYNVPVAVDPQLKTGLLDLQAAGLNATLYCTAGQVTDWFGTLPSGVTVSGVNLTISPQMECFAKPNNAGSQPDTSYWHTWRYDDYPWTAAGDQLFNPAPGNVFLRVLARFLSGGYQGTPPAFLATAGNPNTSNFGNTKVDYTGLQEPELLPAVNRLLDFRELHGFDLPDGIIPFDFRDGGGSVELGWDPRDNYNTRKMTYFHVTANTAITPPAGSIIRWYREELVPVQRVG